MHFRTRPLVYCADPPPPMQDFLLPETARKVVRDTLFSLLTCPPPYAVAAAVREVTRMLGECACMKGAMRAWCAALSAVCLSAQIPQWPA